MKITFLSVKDKNTDAEIWIRTDKNFKTKHKMDRGVGGKANLEEHRQTEEEEHRQTGEEVHW